MAAPLSPCPCRILLFVRNAEDRALLTEALSARHAVASGVSATDLDQPFDLCIVDGPSLDALGDAVQARRSREAPLFLPVLLLTTREDVGLATVELWRLVDEMLVTPVLRAELEARVRVLLRARASALALDAERGRLHALLETMPAGAIFADPSGQVTFANAEAQSQLGGPPTGTAWGPAGRYELETLDGRPYPASDLPLVAALERLETTTAHEVVIRHHDDTRRIVSVSGRPVRDDRGALVGAVAVLVDITARREAEEALRESEALFRSLADNANAGISIVQDRRYVYANPYLARITGYSREELADMDIGDIVAPRDRAMVMERARLRQAGARDLPSRYQFAMQAKDGREITLDMAAALTTYHGRPAIVAIAQDITEQAHSEEALRQSEAKYRALFENIREAVLINELIVDEAGQVTDWTVHDANPEVGRQMGVPEASMIGHRGSEMFGPDIFPEFLRAISQVCATGEPLRLDMYLPINERFYLAGFFLLHGQLLANVALDITDRTRTEQALRDSEARYHAFSEASTEGILVHERGVILEVNQSFADHLGYAVDELRGRSVLEITAPESREEAIRHMLAGDPGPYVACSLHKDGSCTLGEIRARNFEYQGRQVRLVAVRDVTEQKAAEAERERLLAEVQQRIAVMDATLAAVADGLILYSPTGTIARTNPAADRLLGFTAEERRLSIADRWARRRTRTPDGRLLAPEEIPVLLAMRGRAVAGRMVVMAGADGADVWLSVGAAPIYDGGAFIGVVCSYTDITAMHDLQERQQDFTRMVSHDLRAPLTIIGGHAQVLRDILTEAGINGEARFSIDATLRGVQRMEAMIQDLVDAARLEGGQLRLALAPVDLRAYVPDMLVRSAAALDVSRVQCDLAADLPPVLADYNRLERIITNLLSNALKYSDPGTPVVLRARRAGGAVEIAVTDQGRGIAPEDQARLFERFVRINPESQAEGVGLGLYITRLLVEAHGGHIGVESAPGQGSTFTVALPSAA